MTLEKLSLCSHVLRKKRIGIMGGTFDPIHYGHLLAAEEAYFALDLEEVIFVPTGQSYHKKDRRVSSAEDRYLMTFLATLDNPHFTVSRIEIDRKEPSHTVDTLREMSHWYAAGSTEFFFITGLDAVLDISSWKECSSIIRLSKIVAVNRPGYSPSNLRKLPANIQNVIIPLTIPLLSISSTDIRKRVAEGENVRYLVPSQVEQYIYKKALYKRSGR